MDLELTGKHVLITGASKGIGLAVAEGLAAEGCHLHLAARDGATLAGAAHKLRQQFARSEVHTYEADLSLPEDQKRLAQQCGFVDILVNNAGANPGGDLLNASEEVWRKSWDLKVFGYINLCREILGAMKQRGSGVICNVVGNAGERLRPQYIIGSTGNAALIAFTRALGSQTTDFGVRVLGVNPGMTATERGERMLRGWSETKYGTPERWREFEQDMDLPFGRMSYPKEIADVVTFLVSPRASYVSGVVLTADGGAVYRNE